jgi:tetratricopeptide (TPR) repeat protein
MIIWIRNRRGWVAAVFCVLAAIFAASFVIGGVGTGSNASLSDIFNNDGGGGSTTPQASSIGSLEKKVKAQPKNAQAWQQLADAYASASRPSDEARAMGRVVALKPGNLENLQRLAAAQAQVASNQSNQAQQLQQRAYTSSPANDSTFSGGTLGTLSEDPVTIAQAAAESEEQGKLLEQASTYSTRANTWWKRSSGTYAKLVALPAFAKNDLAASIWLNYASAAQSASDTKTALEAYDAFLKLAPDDVNAPQVRSIVKELKKASTTDSTTVTATP